jgi:glycosyltransferase involved in cell wall biosynthesis
MRIQFVNENIGGHATMHRHVRAALANSTSIHPTFLDLPTPSLARRLLGAQVPVLDRLDLDLQLIRARLTQSAVARRHLSRLETTPDLLHFYTQNTALLSVDLMRRIPSVVSIDATNRQNSYLLPYRRPTRFTPASVAATHWMERRVLVSARRIVAHSLWAADSVLGYGIPANRVEVIPFGISVPPARPAMPSNDLPRIAFVGTSMERKGGWHLLRIWKRFLSDRSRLVLVTPERVTPEPGIEVRNDVRPGDGRLEEILAGSDIFAFPSMMDTYGYALIEAMAAELPVVALDHAAAPEIVADGITGLVVPRGDDEAFASALLGLIGDADARHEMGVAGRRRVLERFDAEVTTAGLMSVMRDVLA